MPETGNDWIALIFDKSVTAGIAVYLIRVVTEELRANTRSNDRLADEIKNDRSHSATRMSEIREFMQQMVQLFHAQRDAHRK